VNALARPFDIAKRSLTGDRAVNQDRCQVLFGGETLMMSLGDGLGGHPRGEVAAQLLIDVAEHMFRETPKPIDNPTRFMLRIVAKAHRDILRFGRRHRPTIAPRTTAVIAIVQHGKLFWVHVGDSRLYLMRQGRLLARTEDHTLTVATPHPRTSLTRCLGGLEQPPMTTCAPAMTLRKDDVVLLCTDGLWGQMPATLLARAFQPGPRPIARQLESVTDQARRHPHSDNVTAIALRWQGEAELPIVHSAQSLHANTPTTNR
jgi:serine/threonine protein phosphatase PrpC